MHANICIFLDLEYCYPGMIKGTPRPTSKDERQIVQIAAVKYDTQKQQEIEIFDLLVKPINMPQVTEFFTELTGISQYQVEKRGVSLEEALERLLVFCNGYTVMTYDQDWYVIDQNYSYLKKPNPFLEFIRVKSLLSGWGINPSEYSSGTLYKAVGANMEGHVHNALHDVRSMAKAVSILRGREVNSSQETA